MNAVDDSENSETEKYEHEHECEEDVHCKDGMENGNTTGDSNVVTPLEGGGSGSAKRTRRVRV